MGLVNGSKTGLKKHTLQSFFAGPGPWLGPPTKKDGKFKFENSKNVNLWKSCLFVHLYRDYYRTWVGSGDCRQDTAVPPAKPLLRLAALASL